MESQIQCPVCTLYLHVGMNLQDHLDTHPKEKVISALVNLMLVQQRANDDDPNNFQCSRYEPLADDIQAVTSEQNESKCIPTQKTNQLNYYTPVKQQTSHPVMILNRAGAFHEKPGASCENVQRQKVSTILPTVSVSTGKFHLIATKTSQNIPPPPPYDASVLESFTHRLAYQRNQSTTTPVVTPPENSSVSNQGCNENGRVSAEQESSLVRNRSSDGTVNLLSTQYHLQKGDSNKSQTDSECNENAHSELSQNMISKSNHLNETNVECEQDESESITNPEDYSLENVDNDESLSVIHLNNSHIKQEKILGQPSKNSEKTSERRKFGLKVLSNVKVPPNTVLNVSTLNSQFSEAINSKNMIIIGSSSSSSSSNSSSSAIVNVKLKSPEQSHVERKRTHTMKKLGETRDEKSTETTTSASSEQNSAEPSNDVSQREKSTAKETEMQASCSNPMPSASNASISKPCSSKATSVIRLASPKSMCSPNHPTEVTQPRSMIKQLYNKPPKKLVVKLKKPFVPVIGEEANLHPPEMSADQTEKTVKIEKLSKDDEYVPNNIQNHSIHDLTKHEDLECSEEVPFSPLRQSYTPVPVNHHHSVTNDNAQVVNAVANPTVLPGCSSMTEDHLEQDSVKRKQAHKEQEVNDQNKVKENGNESLIDNYTVAVNTSVGDDNEGKVVIFSISSVSDENNEQSKSWRHQKAPSSSSTRSNFCENENESDQNVYYVGVSTSSEPASSSQSELSNTAGTSQVEYSVPNFLGYNESHGDEYFYSGISLSPNNNWNQRFSPQYAPFEANKNSYMDLDLYKNTSSGERAPSTDSLNIRTDEKMPAKGEISEQESNGDIDGSWSHQIYPLQENDNLPRYTSSYDTTVARESWSLSNEQNLSHAMENMSTILSKFTSLEPSDQNIDIKPITDHLLVELKITKPRMYTKTRKYRCPICAQVYSTLKEKRAHMISDHEYQEGLATIKSPKDISKLLKVKKPIATITSASCSTLGPIELPIMECRQEETECVKPFTNLNNYLLSYNWTTLRAKPVEGPVEKDSKLFVIIENGNNYVCKTCEECFDSIRAYDNHMGTHPAECYTCGRTFKRWVNFSVHLKRHLNIREHSCNHCSKRFVLRQNLIEHMRIHSNEAPLKCNICLKRFKRYSNLIQHRNRHHLNMRPKDKDFICFCGEVFHSQAKIAWHRETHDAKPKCCPYCRERFMHKNSLVRHIRLSHTERFHLFKRDSVECPYCKKKYLKSSLKLHMEQHRTSKTKYECTICNKALTTKWNLKQHKWIHASRSSKPFKCVLCTKAFIRETEYTSHMNTHKSIKPYTCDHCGCQFARKYNWLRHTREHETPKKFRCDTCNKVFHRAYYLKEHKRSHTGERPFECAICGKTSTTKTNHNKHVKIHHARDPLTAEG